MLVPFREGDDKCLGEPTRMAATILDPVFAALGLDELFASVKFASKIKYDLAGVVRLLVYGRLLDPRPSARRWARTRTGTGPL